MQLKLLQAIAKTLDSITAQEVEKFLEQEIILKFCAFKYIKLDQHLVHKVKRLQQLTRTYDFEFKFAPALNHNDIGLVEITN